MLQNCAHALHLMTSLLVVWNYLALRLSITPYVKAKGNQQTNQLLATSSPIQKNHGKAVHSTKWV